MFETRQPLVLDEVGRLRTSRGEVIIVLTENPEIMPLAQFRAYVVLADWLPREEPVAMFVTTNFRKTGEREVHLVYRSAAIRYDAEHDGDCGSVAVQIGTWLFDNGYLTHHSASRSSAGERWAEKVGGVRPPLDCRGSAPEDSTRRGGSAWKALCRTDWSEWLSIRT